MILSIQQANETFRFIHKAHHHCKSLPPHLDNIAFTCGAIQLLCLLTFCYGLLIFFLFVAIYIRTQVRTLSTVLMRVASRVQLPLNCFLTTSVFLSQRSKLSIETWSVKMWGGCIWHSCFFFFLKAGLNQALLTKILSLQIFASFQDRQVWFIWWRGNNVCKGYHYL